MRRPVAVGLIANLQRGNAAAGREHVLPEQGLDQPDAAVRADAGQALRVGAAAEGRVQHKGHVEVVQRARRVRRRRVGAQVAGGGLVVLGIADEIPEDISGLLPVSAWPKYTYLRRKEELSFRPSQLLERASDLVESFNASLFAPSLSTVMMVDETQLKPAALPIAQLKDLPWQAVVAGYYGSGKVVMLNTGSTWHWVMKTDGGEEHHGQFWAKIVSWSASNSQQRVVIRPAGARLALNDAHDIALDIKDIRFRPDNNATVKPTILGPDGQLVDLNFMLDPRVEGRFKGRFAPTRPGLYRFSFDITTNDGDKVTEQAEFIVQDISPELAPAPMDENRLRSLAKVTGGRFYNYRDLDSLDQITVAEQVNMVEDRTYWLASWIFLLAVILSVIPDWWLRRRIGLK